MDALRSTAHRLYTARNVSAVILLGEAVLCALIIRFVAYTEIDWEAYMTQVKAYKAGERDYTAIKGGTGPLVYPAGHVYVYSALHTLTDDGQDRRTAQYIFAAIYLATLALVLRIHSRVRSIPPWSYALLSMSKRLHSIYLLRLFNDGVAMLPLYGAILCAVERRWRLGSLLFSLALSVKMNILLFAPAFALFMLLDAGIVECLWNGAAIVGVQVLLGLPFLLHDPQAYLSRAFELSRAFYYKWTVNWRFVDEQTFLSPSFARSLLVGHLSLLLVFAIKWTSAHGGLVRVVQRALRHPSRPASIGHQPIPRQDILFGLFTANLIGITCARSLHYQFLAWYFHQIPLLLFSTPFPTPIKLALWATIEYSWNVYPSTSLSSALLLAAHLLILLGLLISRRKSTTSHDAR